MVKKQWANTQGSWAEGTFLLRVIVASWCEGLSFSCQHSNFKSSAMGLSRILPFILVFIRVQTQEEKKLMRQWLSMLLGSDFSHLIFCEL